MWQKLGSDFVVILRHIRLCDTGIFKEHLIRVRNLNTFYDQTHPPSSRSSFVLPLLTDSGSVLTGFRRASA